MSWTEGNLRSAIESWNRWLGEIIQILTQSPEYFRDGAVWRVILSIHAALQGIGLGLLVLFFVIGVVKTCGTFAEMKRPEVAIKMFIRFALARAVVVYGLELMMAIFSIVQGIIQQTLLAAGFLGVDSVTLPEEIATAIDNTSFLDRFPMWIVALLGSIVIFVLGIILIMSVYGRFFRLYLYTAIAPIPLSSFAGEPTSSMGRNFIKSYAAVCLEGAVIVLAMVIFTAFASSPPNVDTDVSPVTQVWAYIGEVAFNMLVLVGMVKTADRLTEKLLGLGG